MCHTAVVAPSRQSVAGLTCRSLSEPMTAWEPSGERAQVRKVHSSSTLSTISQFSVSQTWKQERKTLSTVPYYACTSNECCRWGDICVHCMYMGVYVIVTAYKKGVYHVCQTRGGGVLRVKGLHPDPCMLSTVYWLVCTLCCTYRLAAVCLKTLMLCKDPVVQVCALLFWLRVHTSLWNSIMAILYSDIYTLLV